MLQLHKGARVQLLAQLARKPTSEEIILRLQQSEKSSEAKQKTVAHETCGANDFAGLSTFSFAHMLKVERQSCTCAYVVSGRSLLFGSSTLLPHH